MIYSKMNNYDRNTIIARKGGCGSGSGDTKVATNLTPIELSYDLEVPTNFIKGLDGKSAYQSALEGGYLGTEEEFYKNLKKAGEGLDVSDLDIDPAKLGITAEDVLIGKDIVVTSPIGSYNEGDVISASHSLYDVLLMLTKEGYTIPTYVLPTINDIELVTTKDISGIEVGDTVTLNITVNYTQNDAGASSGVKYYINDLLLGETPAPNVTFSKPHKFTERHNILKVVVSYTEGPIKTDGEGRAYEKGRIKAGELTSTLEIEAYNSENTLFAGSSLNELTQIDINNNNFIKSLFTKYDNPKNGPRGYIVEIPNGSKTIVVAYPARLGRMHDMRNLRTSINEIDSFEENLFTTYVYGNDTTPTLYNVYFYASSVELDNLTYEIMI